VIYGGRIIGAKIRAEDDRNSSRRPRAAAVRCCDRKELLRLRARAMLPEHNRVIFLFC
jgi:hypothetical protein